MSGTYRERSDAWLQERGIPTNPWFATSEEDPWLLRPAREVAERAMALTVVAASAMSSGEFTGAMVHEWLNEFGIGHALTPRESAFLADQNPKERDLIDCSWRIESAWTLAWALNWADQLGPFEEADREPWFYDNVFMADGEKLLREANLRPEPEIHAELDLTIRLHWAIRHRGSDIPNIHTSVVMERHHAFNWLTDLETPWEEITTDT